MEPSTYISLSGQLALQKRLDTIANNVANATTPGFRAEEVTFSSVLSRQGMAFSDTGKATFSVAAGPVVETGSKLDVAIVGDAWLSIETPGGTVYTRDGRMRVSQGGELETMGGYRVLDAGGAPILVNPSLGEVSIGRNGAITQNGNDVGTLALFRLPPDARLTRADGTALASDRPAVLVSDFTEAGVVQGRIESANVNPILEMTRMIAVTRAFEALSSSIERTDRQMSDAIKTLAGGLR